MDEVPVGLSVVDRLRKAKGRPEGRPAAVSAQQLSSGALLATALVAAVVLAAVVAVTFLGADALIGLFRSWGFEQHLHSSPLRYPGATQRRAGKNSRVAGNTNAERGPGRSGG